MQRRRFLAVLSSLSASVCAGLAKVASAADEPAGNRPSAKPMIGVHIAAHSLYDEGFDHCLDFLRATAAIDTLLVTSNSYYGAMVRPKQVQGDHGVPIRDGTNRRLTPLWHPPRERFYADTPLRHQRPAADLEYAGREIFADLAEPAARRGMNVHERLYEPGGKDTAKHIVNWQRVQTVDVFGQPSSKPCWNNPDYLAFIVASVRDLFDAYPLDGIQYGAERNGPLSRLIDWPAAAPTCFCEHCRRRAEREQVDFDRAREGLLAMCRFVNGLENGNDAKPDGAMVGFMRLLMQYPEILAWESMHYRSGEELHRRIRDAVKAIRPNARVGRHIDHSQSSWDMLFRAAMPYARMAEASDYLKLSTYHDILGPRLRRMIVERYGRHVLKDAPAADLLALFYAVAGHDPAHEPSLNELKQRGLSPEYVYREVKRAVEGVAGKAAIYAGIAIDVPKAGEGWGSEPWPSDPQTVYRCTRRAFDAGAAGIVVCREYEEMREPSLRAIGRAIADHHNTASAAGGTQ